MIPIVILDDSTFFSEIPEKIGGFMLTNCCSITSHGCIEIACSQYMHGQNVPLHFSVKEILSVSEDHIVVVFE